MNRLGQASIAAVLLASPLAAEVSPRGSFAHKGQCRITAIREIGSRFQGEPLSPPKDRLQDSGTAVAFANQRLMISYEFSPIVYRWRVGDKAKLCIVSLPQGCPKGDKRGIIYKATNLRTNTNWLAADSQHSCGGA